LTRRRVVAGLLLRVGFSKLVFFGQILMKSLCLDEEINVQGGNGFDFIRFVVELGFNDIFAELLEVESSAVVLVIDLSGVE